MTAVAKSQTNRARNVAAGVVSGAGVVSQCFKRRILTRVFQVGAGKACTPILPPVRGSGRGVVSARQLKRRVRADGWCRAQMHTRTERRDENSSQMRSRAGGVQSPTCLFPLVETSVHSAATWEQAALLDGNRRLKRISGTHQHRGFTCATTIDCATAMQECSFRATDADEKPARSANQRF